MYLLNSVWQAIIIAQRRMLASQHFVRFTSSVLAQKLPFVQHLADSALSVTAQLHALVANPMTRYVRMESTRSPTRLSSDQGKLRLGAV